MNVIKVYGGLGNQLFQYAFGRAQMENGIDVCYNITWFSKPQKRTKWPYCLDKFHVRIKTNIFLGQRTIKERAFNYLKNLTFLKLDNCNFYGYWHHPKYFEKILPVLEKEFQVKEIFYTEEFKELRKKIIDENSISLHVRRGDFITIKGHHILPLEYYVEALKQMPEGNIYVFSDDIPWCKVNFYDFKKRITYVHLREYLDFELMRLCKHNIIANSTFSWWAAYLNNHLEKIIISPHQWKVSEKKQAMLGEEFLNPPGWIRLTLAKGWTHY